MGMILLMLAILAAIATIASGVWVAVALMAAISSTKRPPSAVQRPEGADSA